MPFEADEPGLGPVADRIADHVAAQLATRPGARCIGPARTRAFQSASLAALAERTGATYLMTGRVGRRRAAASSSLTSLLHNNKEHMAWITKWLTDKVGEFGPSSRTLDGENGGDKILFFLKGGQAP